MFTKKWTCVLILPCIVGVIGITRPTSIVLENNGYKNILVAISPRILEDKKLIENIKDMFTKGSSYLYTATMKRAFYKDVTILIPSSWSNDPSYKPATTEVLENAHVLFTSPSPVLNMSDSENDPIPRDFPSTRRFGGCGIPGVRINLSPDFFAKRTLSDTVGSPDRAFVKEWGQFRWGVYTEFPAKGEEQFYFSPKEGRLKPIGCTKNMDIRSYRYPYEICPTEITKVEDRNTCILFPHSTKNSKASIMCTPKLKEVVYFCDDSSDPAMEHNYEAPTKQNRVCKHRSTWSVILDSPDFKNNNNPPANIADTTPTFTLLQAAKTRRVILMMDTSAEMDDESFSQVKQAAADHIHSGISTGSQVGVVTFSDDAKVLYPMTTINTNQDRQNLKNSLPRSRDGSRRNASIGIERTLQILEKKGDKDTTSEILTLTDGASLSFPEEIILEIKGSGIRWTVIAFNQYPQQKTIDTVHSTGGNVHYAGNNSNSTTLLDSIVLLRQDPTGSHNPSTQLTSKAGKILPGNDLTGDVSVDEDVGRNTIFTIMYTKQEPTITITSPTGRIYNKHYPEYQTDGDFNTVRIEIPEIAEVGTWTYKVVNNFSQIQKLSIMVVSDSVDTEREPVKVEGVLSSSSVALPDRISIHAEVTKSSHPVTGLQVTAIIDRPYSPSVTLQLLDNGTGADITKDDGIYSRFFTYLTGSGEYSVKIEVNDSSNDPSNNTSVLGYSDTGRYTRAIRTGLSRSTSAGTFLFTSGTVSSHAAPPSPDHNIDIWPPARITDLTILKTSHKEQTVHLAWTAPGDDLDNDIATSYEIMMSSDFEDMLHHGNSFVILSQNDLVHGDIKAPRLAGTLENFIVKIPYKKGSKVAFVFSVRAVDKQGNLGEKSNLVSEAFGYTSDYTNKNYHQYTKENLPSTTKPSFFNVFVGILTGTCILVIGASFIVLLRSNHFKSKKSLTKKKIIV